MPRQPIAIDGFKIPLPNRKTLREKYGGMGPGANSPTAIASVAYDVLRGIVLDAQLDSLRTDERTLAIRHMNNIRDHQRVNLMHAMFIFDRGYASWKLIRHIADDIHAKYLFRLRANQRPRQLRLPGFSVASPWVLWYSTGGVLCGKGATIANLLR